MVNEQFDGASDACFPADQSIAFEVEHHLMGGRSRDGEEALHVALGRSATIYQAVGPDEGEILTLLFGEARVFFLPFHQRLNLNHGRRRALHRPQSNSCGALFAGMGSRRIRLS